MAAAAAVPEQSEALNLGKKRTSPGSVNNNNNEDEDDSDAENGRGGGRVARGRHDDEDGNDGDGNDGDGNHEDGIDEDGNDEDGNDEDADDGPAAKRIKTERCSPVQAVATIGCYDDNSSGEDDDDGEEENATRQTVADFKRYGVGGPARRSPTPPADEDVVEMDINASTGGEYRLYNAYTRDGYKNLKKHSTPRDILRFSYETILWWVYWILNKR